MKQNNIDRKKLNNLLETLKIFKFDKYYLNQKNIKLKNFIFKTPPLSIFGFLCIFFSFSPLFIYLYQIKFLSESEKKLLNINDFFIVIVIVLFFSLFGFLMIFLASFLEIKKKNKKLPRMVRINKVKFNRYYIKLAKKLALENSKEILSDVKEIITLTIKESESRYSYFSKFVPILSIMYVVLILYGFGLSIQVLEQKTNWGNLIPVSMVTLLTLILQWFFDWKVQADILKYKKFLFVVEKAQIIAEEIEIDKNYS